ncbi:hypothetical protein M5D96_008673 [Drosophila gunungcola]|uniref:Sema domain-containing protein n=1 Tax=Drosophila gunungcola TaxID=103775 RepID=A0A9Q0BP60_9MUSC|nr:hypothetical protein M5D96_008673 [Drosophila gunungcola]
MCKDMDEADLSPYYHVKDFSCGPLHYKTFYTDERNNALYVGAMDRIFRLNLRNISQSICERDVLILEPTGSDILNCVSKGKREVSLAQ